MDKVKHEWKDTTEIILNDDGGEEEIIVVKCRLCDKRKSSSVPYPVSGTATNKVIIENLKTKETIETLIEGNFVLDLANLPSGYADEDKFCNVKPKVHNFEIKVNGAKIKFIPNVIIGYSEVNE